MRRCAAWLWVLAVLCFSGGCGKPSGPAVGEDVDPKVRADELAELAGTWVYERQVVEGNEVPLAQVGRGNIVITGNTLTRNLNLAEKGGLPPLKSSLSVDPTKTPKQLDDDAIRPFGTSRRPGIYKLEGDRLTLCYDNTGGPRPSTFDSPAGSSLVLTVLRRQSK